MVSEKVISVQQNSTNASQGFKPDYIYWINHYAGLLWRWKWYILPTFPILVVTWLLLVITFGKVRPVLSASVLLGLENQSTVLVLPEASSNGLGKMKLIQSRNFLGEIVDTLSLNLVIPKYNRSSIFSFVDVDSSAAIGKYHFSIDERTRLSYTIWITNKRLGLSRKVIATGTLPSLDTLRVPGMTLVFSPGFLKKPVSFDFYIVPRQDAVEDLRNRLVIQGNPKRDPMQEGVVVIILSGTDPELISTTINTIADKFVEKNLSFRKRKTSEVMKALHTQLQAASAQLLQDENRIRAFKEENPKVGLGIDAQNAIANITLLESKDLSISTEIEDAKDLQKRLSEQTGNDKDQTTNEALLFLSSRKISGAIVLQQDFNTQLQQKSTLLSNRYSLDHPMIKDLQSKIDAISTKTIQLLMDFISKQEEELTKTRTQKTLSSNQLKGLPQKEMQLAALTRQQQINSEIYSNILTRFNQSKIADETEVPDIYIMDYSVPPEDASAKKELIKLLAIGLFICVLISFGPAIIVDLFDRRPRSENDLKRFMNFPVLETIPVLNKKKNNKKPSPKEAINQTIDPKLLLAGPTVTYVHEIFRSLRAKLNYRLENINGKSFMVTGYDSGEGKSLIAANMAIMAAQQHTPTLLIDADMRRGVLHNTFYVENQPGLSDLLLCDHQITEQMLRSSIKPTSFPHLFLLTAGSQVENPTELLTSRLFKGIMQWVDTRFAMIIIDAPPLSPVTDAVIINNVVSGAVLVIRAGKTNTVGLNKVINEFPTFKEKILGLVLNGVNSVSKRKQYNAYYYKNSQGQKPVQPLLLTAQVSSDNEEE
jgi:tyrosine-protein kinase Etk/Wzc